MKVTCKLELADFRAFERAIVAHKPLGTRWLNRFFVPTVIFFAITITAFDSSFRERLARNGVRELMTMALIYGGVALFLTVIRWWRTQMENKKILVATMFREPVTFEINEEGVIGNDADGQNFMRWNAVKEIWNEAEHLIVILGENHGMFIPKRAFDSPQDAQNFAAFAQNQWQNAHPLSPSAPPISAPK